MSDGPYILRIRELEAERDRYKTALQWIVDHAQDEDALSERAIGCPNSGHTEMHPEPWDCPTCHSSWWATDGTHPSEEGSYAMQAVAREALEGGSGD